MSHLVVPSRPRKTFDPVHSCLVPRKTVDLEGLPIPEASQLPLLHHGLVPGRSWSRELEFHGAYGTIF